MLSKVKKKSPTLIINLQLTNFEHMSYTVITNRQKKYI